MGQLIVDRYIIKEPIINIIHRIKDELTNGKLKDIISKNGQVLVSCPHHNNGLEVHPGCFVLTRDDLEEANKGDFNCFVCNCKGNFVRFIAECFDQTDDWAKRWLIERYGDTMFEYALDLPEIDLNPEVPEYLNEHTLDKFKPYHPYLAKRGISEAIAKKFNVKYDPATQCIVFPVYDLKGNLKFLTRRNIVKKEFTIDKGVDKSDVYLLNFALTEGYKDIIIVESQFNALTCWEYGFPGVALLGSGTTKEQIETLNNSGIRHFILMYDNDDAGRHGAEKFKRLIRKDVFVTDVIMPQGKDVNDLTRDEFNILLNNYL